jgi:hypothetical protein
MSAGGSRINVARAEQTGAQPALAPVLQPLNQTQFFLRPDQMELLKWKVNGTTNKFTAAISDYHGRPLLSKTVEANNGELNLPLQLAPGYYEIDFGAEQQRFGLIVAAPHQGAADKFFAIDAALSWLETRPQMRSDLIALLKRSGIGMVRERLSWSPMNPKVGEWDFETARQFDTLRGEYQRQGIQVLDLFHGAPEWAKTEASNPFPQKLVETKNSWQTIDKHWQGAWNALEVWNEPDIDSGGDLPADQLLPTIKTTNYGLREIQSPTLVGGGVFGYFNPGYIRSAVKNGLLDQIDFASFHTYAKAPAMEQIVGDYRRALTVDGKTVPLWLTESGQPWKSGKARAALAEDALSAQEISMKAVEARACGIERYFAFVYPFYIEGASNFGMMGQEVTPLRSLAGYVQAVEALSGRTYVGDLTLKDAGVQRARVFARGDDAVVVFYAEDANPDAVVTWAGVVKSVQGIDGRPLKPLSNGAIPLPDGLTYVHTSLQNLQGITRQTTAAALAATAKTARTARPPASAIMLQPLLPTGTQASKRGYKVATAALGAFPLRVRVTNLSKERKQVTLRAALDNGTSLKPQTIALDALATAEPQWDIDLGAALQNSKNESLELTVSGQEQGGAAISPLAVELFSERDLESYLRLYPNSVRLDLTDLPRWQSNIASAGKMTMQLLDGGHWQLKSTIPTGDRWAFPNYLLPEGSDWRGSEGVVIRGRTFAPATVRLMVKEKSGATYFTPFSIFPADGQWHALSLRWGDLAALPSAPPDANSKLNLNEIVSISLGMNQKTAESTLEVSDFYLARKAN